MIIKAIIRIGNNLYFNLTSLLGLMAVQDLMYVWLANGDWKK